MGPRALVLGLARQGWRLGSAVESPRRARSVSRFARGPRRAAVRRRLSAYGLASAVVLAPLWGARFLRPVRGTLAPSRASKRLALPGGPRRGPGRPRARPPPGGAADAVRPRRRPRPGLCALPFARPCGGSPPPPALLCSRGSLRRRRSARPARAGGPGVARSGAPLLGARPPLGFARPPPAPSCIW